MTFKEWAEEYRITENILKEEIHKLKSELPTAPTNMLSSINRSIDIMYQMYLDCRKTADTLSIRRGSID